MSSAPIESVLPNRVVTREQAERSLEAQHHLSGRRPALDGLRALAVTAVAMYHFGGGDYSWLPGGYLGVDVFFVLSGYLITCLLLEEYARQGRIDLLGFWVRRLRRLVPALFLVLLTVCAWVWWATPPDAYPNRRSDIFWTVGYLANWHLISSSEDYFATYTAASPLRHAWSLAVEEQFYLVWPTLLLTLMWIGRRWLSGRGRALVAAGAAAGLALSAWAMAAMYSPLDASRAYYSTQGRVQELFVGVLLAVLIRKVPTGRRLPLIGTLGLGVLLVAIFRLRDTASIYYHGGALAVSLAAAAVILVLELRPTGRLAKGFSWRPAVALGRISYGVYLWHWPVVVAIPVIAAQSPGEQLIRQALRVAITLGAAAASYRLVEQPIMRSRRALRSPRRVIVAAAAASGIVVAVAIPATALPGTLAQQVSHTSDRTCAGERGDFLVSCTWPAGASVGVRPARLAVLGDSTARALSAGLDDWANQTSSTWVEAAWRRCSSTGLMVWPSSQSRPDGSATTCHDQAPALITNALQEYRPSTVLIAEFWVNNQPLLIDGHRAQPGTKEYADALRSAYLGIVDQVAAYGGHAVFLELPPPGEPLGAVIAADRPAGSVRSGVPGNGKYVDSFNAILRSVAQARPDVASTVSLTDVICPNGACGPLQGDVLVRYDGVHYSIPFARELVPVLMSRIGLSAP
jgi:peptidoglycan/LPS O-acetylase OafA/YrhL